MFRSAWPFAALGPCAVFTKPTASFLGNKTWTQDHTSVLCRLRQALIVSFVEGSDMSDGAQGVDE